MRQSAEMGPGSVTGSVAAKLDKLEKSKMVSDRCDTQMEKKMKTLLKGLVPNKDCENI